MKDQAEYKPKGKVKIITLNVLFFLGCVGILLFLLRAPEETTSTLPHDEIHEKYHQIKGKKAAEKFCLSCHEDGKEAPLSAEHPPKYRCLFCHKRQ